MQFFVGASERLDQISTLLEAPPLEVTAEELLDLWQVDTLRFVCSRPPLMDDHPELPLRLRGAFGRRLAELPPQLDRRGCPSPSAWSMLFEPLARAARGGEIPRPFVIHAWPEGTRLIIELSLIGFASSWLDAAAQAMTSAIEGGVALRADRAHRVGIMIEDVLVRRRVPVQPPRGREAILTFRSPVVVRHGRRLVEDARSILRSVPRRVAALAPFQLCRLTSEDGFDQSIDALEIDDRDLTLHRWERHSRRQGNVPIPMAGYLGQLRIRGDLGPLTPLLTIAETCNIGSHASLGTGWFDLSVYP